MRYLEGRFLAVGRTSRRNAVDRVGLRVRVPREWGMEPHRGLSIRNVRGIIGVRPGPRQWLSIGSSGPQGVPGIPCDAEEIMRWGE